MKTLEVVPGKSRIRVGREDDLIEIAEDHFLRIPGRWTSSRRVLLTSEEVKFVRDALSEVLAMDELAELPGAATTLRLYPSGVLFAPFDPDPDLIQIEDIAHGLATTNRFGGALAEPYNVAQHSLIVCGFCTEQPLWGLLHDAVEALSGLGDVCGPVKRHPLLHGPVKRLERGIERAIAQRFDLPEDFAEAPCVKRADRLAYAWEDRDLRGRTTDDAWTQPLLDKLPKTRLTAMDWRSAKSAFLTTFEHLMGRRLVGVQEKV